jgi:hypothetical protein
MKPISPLFVGKGSACGLDSCVRMVEEVDAIAAVDAIIRRRSRGKGKRWKGKVENGIGLGRLVACTWQGFEGRQHQMKGREGGEERKEGRIKAALVRNNHHSLFVAPLLATHPG